MARRDARGQAPALAIASNVAAAGAVALALLPAAAPAGACGHCITDKIAATYDDAVVTRAAARGDVVIVLEVRSDAGGAAAAPRVRAAIARAAGVVPGTIRTSAEPAAAAFACDPLRRHPREVVRAIRARLAAQGVTIVPIEMRRPTAGAGGTLARR